MTTATQPRTTVPSHLGSEEVWREIASGSFLVLSYVTPSGDPPSAGVMYKAIGRKLYIVAGADSWQARHIASDGRVAVTVPVRRGGILSLVAPIPPATISFHATATVHGPESPAVRPISGELGVLLPPERQESVAVIEVIPGGTFTTYGVGVPLAKMRDTEAAGAHVPVTPGREPAMNIEYGHASRFGNGATVADEFRQRMAARGVAVSVHHIRDVAPDRLPPADLYVFSSPGQWGKPIRSVRRFLSKVRLPAGTRYAILTTELGPPRPDKKTGRMPTDEQIATWQRVRPVMNELLQATGLVNVAEDKVYVTGLKGPLEDGWQAKVEAFAAAAGRAVTAPGRARARTDAAPPAMPGTVQP